jgi:hypothetical protein
MLRNEQLAIGTLKTTLLASLTSLLVSVAMAVESGKPPVLNVLERTTTPLLKCDRPWEDFCMNFCQVMRIGDQWHLWYNAHDHHYKSDADCYFCYASSKDGVQWEKPSLGITDYDGNTNNNILAAGYNIGCVFLDAKAPPAQRFKAVAIREVGGQWWVYGGTSANGIRWTWLDRPMLKKNSDTANVCIPDGDIYRLYVRMWSGASIYTGHRMVGYSESPTFGPFPDPTMILKPDKNDPGDLHFYNSAATKLRGGLYLMLPSGLFTNDGKVFVYAAFSRNGKLFHRLGRTPLLTTGNGFDAKGVYVGPGAVPGAKPGTYWFYYVGTTVPHDDNLPTKVRNGGAIGRFLLGVD